MLVQTLKRRGAIFRIIRKLLKINTNKLIEARKGVLNIHINEIQI